MHWQSPVSIWRLMTCMGHVLNDLNFECFEEPMPQSPKYAAYEELRERLPLSLAAGEAVEGRASAKELIDR